MGQTGTKTPLLPIPSMPTHMWQYVFSFVDVRSLSRLAQVCSSFSPLSRICISEFLGGHWAASKYMSTLSDERSLFWQDANIAYHPKGFLVGGGCAAVYPKAENFELIGCRMGKTLSLHTYFVSGNTFKFANELLIFSNHCNVLSGTFTTIDGQELHSGFAKYLHISKNKTPSFTSEECVQSYTKSKKARANREKIFNLGHGFVKYDLQANRALLGTWNIVQHSTQDNLGYQKTLEIILSETYPYGAKGLLTKSKKDDEEWIVHESEVLVTLNDKNMVSFAILEVIPSQSKQFVGISAVAEWRVSNLSSFVGRFTQRSSSGLTYGSFCGTKKEQVMT